MEQFERIRRDARDEGLSIRALAERHKVHRRTVRAALADAVPPPRKTPQRTAPVLGPHEATIRRWLTEDLTAPRKQRHTARRVWQRLMEEEGVEVAESSVRNLVATLRAEISGPREVMVPQTHPPAEEAEVDFGEFTATIAGVVMKIFMFCMRLSHSGKAFHFAYANQAQESFFDGHVRAFAAFGGVPVGMIRYDNLKPAVTRVALGRDRFEHPRFVALRSHYGFDSFYCIPGKDGAHEKGGVEGEIGRFRRRRGPGTNVAQVAAHGALRVDAVLSCRVDAKARVCVRQSYYSVPARHVGRRLEVRLGATRILVLDPAAHGKVIAQHTRSLHKGTEDLVLDHYLEVLVRKPGALAGSTALASAKASGAFTANHQRFWTAARKALGDGAGTRALIGVLLLHRTMSASAIAAGMAAAVADGVFDADLVAVHARRATTGRAATPPIALPTTAAPAATDQRPAPSLAGYDQLLTSSGRQLEEAIA